MEPTGNHPDERPRAADLAPEGVVKRPIGVSILAILLWIAAVLSFIAGISVAFAGPALFEGAAGGVPAGLALVTGLFLVALAAVEAWVGWGLWVGRAWAWTAALVLAGISAVSDLVAIFQGDVLSGVVGLAIVALVVWYLFQPEVQAWFGRRYARPFWARTAA